MKYTPFLFSIIAIVCVIGTFTHVMVKKTTPPTNILQACLVRHSEE